MVRSTRSNNITSLAARIRGVKDKLGKRSVHKVDRIDQGNDLTQLVKTVSAIAYNLQKGKEGNIKKELTPLRYSPHQQE